ncbi:MAG: ribosome small subunit-dependent GTPase A [Bacteroidales bacterium]
MSNRGKKKSYRDAPPKGSGFVRNKENFTKNVDDCDNVGRVITSTGSFYEVKTQKGEIISCVVKGKFRMADIKTTNPVAVGDLVHFLRTDNSEVAQIDKILERKNYIIRKSVNLTKLYSIVAANIDMVFLIVSCKDPRTETMFIDRFLVTANAYNVPCTIVINKVDILDEECRSYATFLSEIYENVGYKVLYTSARKSIGLNELRQCLENKISLFSGNSGVGKSTLINILCPKANQKTAEVSMLHHTGKHATTFATMLQHENISIIDTPGVKSFGVVEFKKGELALYFPEMRDRLEGCKYYNCTHTHEPNCAIKQAVESGKISKERYNNYIKLLNADDMQ